MNTPYVSTPVSEDHLSRTLHLRDLPYLRLDLSDFSLTLRDGVSDWRSLEATAFDPEPNDHEQHENSDRVVDNHMERRLHAGIGKDNYSYNGDCGEWLGESPQGKRPKFPPDLAFSY